MGAGNSYTASAADWELSAGSALRPHQQLLCFLVALNVGDNEICALLPGLMPQLLGMLKLNKLITVRVKEISEKHLGKAADEQLELLTPAILKVMSKVINDTSGNTTLREQLEAGKWVWEQSRGRAKQKTDGDAEASLTQFIKIVDEIRTEREFAPPGKDYATQSAPRKKGDGPDEWIRTLRPKETR